ncbi:MAG TPA: DNA-protecting protein DprA [Gammaproteobacteria bacterium]|nr:DNA-protecting protein DprA [Gammaproteobacteria bacterium]
MNDATEDSSADQDRLRAWLTLAHAPGLGAAGSRALAERCGGAQAVLAAAGRLRAGEDLPAAALEFLRRPDAAVIERDLAWAAGERNYLITLDDPVYPRLLKQIPDPPPVLYLHGEPAAPALLGLALVGSRNPTAGGAATAHDFAAHLAGAGLVIVSGLALGIDAAAHQGALDAGGVTVAVTGTGLDRVYPARHRELAHRIAERGALVSEFPPGTPPLPANFPRRNRLISGLGLGTLVVEAAPKSGSLITARAATEQGREVFAIPGSIHNPLARGCHALIRQGAKLVETADHILEELGPLAAGSAEQAAPAPDSGAAALDADYLRLLECMGYEPVGVDQLVTRSGLTAEQVSSMLLLLELEDQVVSAPGGRYSRVPNESLK